MEGGIGAMLFCQLAILYVTLAAKHAYALTGPFANVPFHQPFNKCAIISTHNGFSVKFFVLN